MPVIETIIFTISVCIILFWISWRKRRMNLFQRCGIPGPKPNFIIGNMGDFHKNRGKCFDQWFETYGEIYGFFLGGKPVVVCHDLELIKIIQIKEFKNFTNRDMMLPDGGVSHEIAGHTIVLAKSEKWKVMRNIISSCFSTSKIKRMIAIMNDPIDIFLLKIRETKQKPFDILKLYKKLVFDIICNCSFGIATNVQREESSTFIQSIAKFLQLDSTNILAGISICFPEFEPIPTLLRRMMDKTKFLMFQPSIHFVVKTCRQIVKQRKTSKSHQSNLLQALIDAEDNSNNEVKKLSSDSVIANVITFMVAGYDTVSNTLGWCSHYLSHHPEVQEKVRLEIMKNIPHENIQYSDLESLQYTNQVISETLRLSSFSVLLFNRICAKDFKYKNIVIPKGATVIIPTPVLQRDPNYWNEPNKFDPERFSPKNITTIKNTIYQPFGDGPRMCAGMKLGQSTMKLILAYLIKSFRLMPCGKKEVEIQHSLFIPHPKNGICAMAIPIENST